ncbi:MAG TPA: C25 family cysteine peptidase [Chitinophagales bacterium]|nr:C25 family cysteine peptidase [Chitinophagales bacterium]
MRKLLLLLILTGVFFKAHSQLYGNEWINYSQTYFKFRILQDGLYRIPYSTLQNFGVPVNSINGSNIQIFGRGQEVPIYVTASGILGTNDYIEFYAVHNDGYWDSTLYADHTWQANDKLSLFTDSAYYYLTWSIVPSTNHIIDAANNISNPPQKEAYCWYTSSRVGGKERISGTQLNRGALALAGQLLWDSDFSNTEGYTDYGFNKSNKDYTVNTPHPYLSGPPAELKTAINGDLDDDHYMIINVNGNQLWSGSYSFYIMTRLDLSIPTLSWLTAPTTVLEYSTAASPSVNDYNSVPWFDLKYPREFDFDNNNALRFSLTSNGANQYLEIGDFDEAGTTPILYDLTEKLRLTAVVENDTEKFLLPPSLQPERQLFLIANDTLAIRKVDSLWTVHFVDYSLPANQGNFIIISHPKLMNDSLGNNYVEQYRAFKEDAYYYPDLPYKAIVVNINDLYDEFAYGIRFHPSAIRKFSHYIYDTWLPQQQRYVFIIGKGIEYSVMNDYPSTKPVSYVPTFGLPGSDELLTSIGYSPRPLFPVGRLSVLNAEEILPYLTKAKDFMLAQHVPNPTVANSAWMKQVMHLCGGSSQADQSYFGGVLHSFEVIIEDTLFGGNVTSFFKDNNNPIELATNAQIDSLLKNGVSLITFFGHSSYNSFDFNLDKPEDYHNDGKYPLLLTNGCLIGNLFTSIHGMSDEFVLADHSGAIGFLGPAVFSVASSLDLYSTNFYINLSAHEYDKPMGDVIQQTISDVYAQGATIDKATAEQMLFAGDPSLKLNTHPKPDYDLESQNVTFDPATVSAGLDSFYLQIITYNLGRAIPDSIYVDVKRTLPGGTEEFLYHKKIKSPHYCDTLRLVIKTEANQAFGMNNFYIKVDAGINDSTANGDVDEISELNNILTPTLFINSDDIIPVWPYNYSIVSAQGVMLKASTVNAFAAQKQYVIQLDTTQFFNSPLLQTKKILQIGGVVKWTPTLTMTDSVVYYWRTSVDTLYGNHTFTWHNASFIYLPGSSPGWNQSHYFQFLSTIQTQGNIELPSNRVFKYVDDIKTIGVYNGNTLWVGGPLQLDDPAFYLNGVRIGKWDCANCGASMQFAVIDSLTGVFWKNYNDAANCSPAYYGSTQCKVGFRSYFFYPTILHPYIEDMKTFLIDTIPDGDYIFMMSNNDMGVYNWNDTMKQIFTDLGLSKIQTITSDVPYVAFFKKHDPDYPIYEVVGDTFTSIIDTNFNFSGEWNDGYIESPLIGPAASWTSLHWKAHSIEPGSDITSLQLIGVNNSGAETVLSNNVLASDTSISGISVSQYPYLKLRMNCLDTTFRTPIQLDYWRINYQPVPEAALNPALYFSLNDTVNQFTAMKLSCAVENLTPWNMDSMLMKYQITDATNVLHTYTKRYGPLAGNDTMHAQYDFETACNCYTGTDYLYVEVNPDNDQPEQYHFNNIGIISFHVVPDNLNPILDVTFDGMHIMDGDLVSAKPDIEIMLKDDNKFVPMNDTSEFKIYFIYPDGSHHNVTFDNVHAFFYPADSTNLTKDNTARAELKAEFLTDGKYQIVVQGYDRSGNASGDNAYRISFEVINKPMISNVFNYPNPFTTSTRFVFTLTGYETPQQMKITIYTITGKVVKEVFLGQLGDIHVGNNITDFSYDGTDQFGDKLANGLYFYKVEAVLNGKRMDHYDNSTDQYFKRGIGKMYLMR